jgi:hypothetical protein
MTLYLNKYFSVVQPSSNAIYWPKCEKERNGVQCSNNKGMGHRDAHIFEVST